MLFSGKRKAIMCVISLQFQIKHLIKALASKRLTKNFALFCVVLAMAGCCWFEDKRAIVKPEPVDIRDRWKILAPFIKAHFDTGDMTLEEIAAELAYQDYLQSLKNH